MVPETALRVIGPAEAIGRVVVDGRIAEVRLRLGARLLDGRVEVADGLPAGARVIVSKEAADLRVGRAARILAEGSAP
ncbi:MAG: hypothetical protein OEL76_17040 [Siculibacillus sp.]|nr:hypothetical protein [Siculibacillus sp.]